MFEFGLLLGLAVAPTVSAYLDTDPQAVWEAGVATARRRGIRGGRLRDPARRQRDEAHRLAEQPACLGAAERRWSRRGGRRHRCSSSSRSEEPPSTAAASSASASFTSSRAPPERSNGYAPPASSAA